MSAKFRSAWLLVLLAHAALFGAAHASDDELPFDDEDDLSDEGQESGEGPERFKNPLCLTLELELASPAKLAPADVTLAIFPDGRKYSFSYQGVSNPKTIAGLAKLGFRTSVQLNPPADPAHIQALHEAGAGLDAGGLWSDPGYRTNGTTRLGGLPRQRAWDLAGSYRQALNAQLPDHFLMAGIHPRGKCPGALANMVYGFGKHQATAYAISCTNYLANSGAIPFSVNVRRYGPQRQVYVPCEDDGMNKGTRKAPNEAVYFEFVAHKFQAVVDSGKAGRVIRFTLDDFEIKDMQAVTRKIEPWGRHPEIWHATIGEVCALAYLKAKSRIAGVRELGPGRLAVDLEIERDLFLPYVRTPLPLRLPDALALKSARLAGLTCRVTERKAAAPAEDLDFDDPLAERKKPAESGAGLFVDLPIREALGGGIAMSLTPQAPDMSAPGAMDLVLVIRNAGSQDLKGARLDWNSVEPNLSIEARGLAQPFDLAAGETRTIKATARAARGIEFGIVPLNAILAGKAGGAERVFVCSGEVSVAPRLSVELEPSSRLPMVPGQQQRCFVYLRNSDFGRAEVRRRWVHHQSVACRGTVSLSLPEGMTCEPESQPFELSVDQDELKLVFTVTNPIWHPEIALMKPVVRLEGESEPIEMLCHGNYVIRDEATLAYQPLDADGLTLHCSWDKDRPTRATIQENRKAPGTRDYHGVIGWCVKASASLSKRPQIVTMFDPFKTVSFEEGTSMVWVKRDPLFKNDRRTNMDKDKAWQGGHNGGFGVAGEVFMGFEIGRPRERGGVWLHRYPGLDGDGFLVAVYRGMENRRAYTFATFNWEDCWNHLALLWHRADRRLEIYLNGERVAKADPGEGEWYARPWDRGKIHGKALNNWSFGADDHGKEMRHLRDEACIFTKALSPEKIRAIYQQGKQSLEEQGQ